MTVYENSFWDYLKWRGDLSVKEQPFNDVDALILSELVYVQFEGIVSPPGRAESITIAEAAKRYVKKTEKTVLYYAQKEQLLDVLAQCPRFSGMMLCNYVSMTDQDAQQQFAAMHVNITPTLTAIVFRGTDSTIVGWKEDFNMSYMMPVPAQQSAVEYVNATARGFAKKYWLAGHSKGGNLAIFSGVFCNKAIQKKIVRINSFDGPGFNRKIVDTIHYRQVQDRIAAYVPVSSIVGMLMEHEEDYLVVDSLETPLRQHEGFSWQIDRNRFVLLDQVDAFSNNTSRILKTWLSKVDGSQKKAFVDAFFGIFEKAGIVELTDLADLDIRSAGNMLRSLAKLPPQVREMVSQLLHTIVEESRK